MADAQINAGAGMPSDEEIARWRETERPRAPSASGMPSDEEIRNFRSTETVQEPLYDPLGNVTGHVAREVEVPKSPQYENYPTISEMPLEGSSVGQKAKILAGLPFARTSAGRENIIRQNVPEARFTTDIHGNRLAVLPERRRDYTFIDSILGRIPNIFEPEGERRYHIQRPDTFNPDLLSSVVTSAIPSIPAVAFAPASIPAAMAVNAGLAGATSGLGTLASNWAGANEPLDLGHLAAEAGLAAFVPGAVGLGGRGVQAMSRFAAGPSRAEDTFRRGFGLESYREDISPGARRALETQSHPERDLINRTEYPWETDPNISAGNKEVLRGLAERGLLPPSMSEGRIRPFSTGEIIADQPEAAAQLARYIEINPSIADKAAPVIENRIATRPARISGEIDDAFGPLGPSQREIIRHIDEARLDESAELTALLRNAGDVTVNTAPALNYINRMLSSPEIPKGGDIERFLLKAQDLLTARGSENLIPGVIVPTTNPQAVQNVLKQLDASITRGSSDPLYAHAPIPTGIPQPRDLRRMLSDALKESVPGYEQSMGNFVDLYAAKEAAERGSKLFALGENRLSREEANFFLSNPETAEYFVAGMRNAINKKMEENAFSLSDLTKAFGRDESSRINGVIDAAFGSEATGRMRDVALKEARRVEVENLLQNAIDRSRASIGLGRAAETERAMPRDVWELKRGIAGSLQGPFSRLRGVSAELPGPAEGYSRYFLAGGNRGPEYLRGVQMGRQERQNIQDWMRASAPLAGGVSSPTERFAGGRVGRKSGGRLMRTDHSARAASLIRAAEAAKKAHNATTESILEQPDEAVARALSIANKAI